jgi:hypothetical protein
MGTSDVDTEGTSIEALENFAQTLRGGPKQWRASSKKINDLKIDEVVLKHE